MCKVIGFFGYIVIVIVRSRNLSISKIYCVRESSVVDKVNDMLHFLVVLS